MNTIPLYPPNQFCRKLLKMHESKYEPMEKTDAEKIMEEILSMQAGLNPDQQVNLHYFNHLGKGSLKKKKN